MAMPYSCLCFPWIYIPVLVGHHHTVYILVYHTHACTQHTAHTHTQHTWVTNVIYMLETQYLIKVHMWGLTGPTPWHPVLQ